MLSLWSFIYNLGSIPQDATPMLRMMLDKPYPFPTDPGLVTIAVADERLLRIGSGETQWVG